MSNRALASGLDEVDNRLVLKGRVDPSIAPVVERARAKGWKTITVKGNIELCRATWFEARMAGLEVKGYKPTNEDDELLKKMEAQRKKLNGSEIVLSGSDIVQDYNTRVIPFLQKRYDELRRQRTKLGVTTTDMDRAYGINLPTGFAKEVDERFDRAKGAFLRAIDARDFFISAARQKLKVKFSFEDGVAKFVSNDAYLSTGRASQSRDLSRNGKI